MITMMIEGSIQEKTDALIRYLACQYIEYHSDEAVKDILYFVYGKPPKGDKKKRDDFYTA